MRVRKQSTSTYVVPLYMVLSTDHITPATSKTVSVTLSKNGAAFGAAAGAVSELSSGVYTLAGHATDTDTLGPLVVLATASGCDPYLVELTVVAFDPFAATNLGLTNFDATVSSRLASASYTTPPTVTQVRTEMDSNSTKLANLDATVSSRLATTGYTAPLTGTTTAQAVLDAVAASYNAAGSIGEKINGASAPSAATVADAVWDEATSGHATAGSTGAALSAAGNAGDPWSTVLPGAYTGNQAGAQLPAIKAKTDTISSGTFNVVSPVVDSATITIKQGDDYKNADGRALFASTTWSNVPSLTGGTITLKVKSSATPFTKAGVVTGAAACYVELTTAETAALPTGIFSFDLEVALANTDVVTIAQGTLEVLKDVR